ncbi:hypothetical protein [Lacticaseibacillus nasuensis]|uniref:Uncharacterized protein n=1 Tax=Lacticaseibacillus nasuensis JCM 17158 TaxID=1291734 RepID=A0A0R1JT00_9LACO|nr:hypothetical protein [Lacticaseibacillus nasuensis]KRK74200.1 hypothetical protein FD02_GL000795 [Lacticaseibacillus nasuensis JCM 17158]
MGSIIQQKQLSAVILAEHLAAIMVTVLIVGWVTMTYTVYQTTTTPLRAAASARYAARVALLRRSTPGELTVHVGSATWHVTITLQKVEVISDAGTTTYTLSRDDLD